MRGSSPRMTTSYGSALVENAPEADDLVLYSRSARKASISSTSLGQAGSPASTT